MALAAKIKRFFSDHRVFYRLLNHKRTATLEEAAEVLGIPQENVIQSILLKDEQGVVLVLMPLDHQLDLTFLSRHSHRQFKIVPAKEFDKYFNDCEPGSHPPFGQAYGIPIILDKSIEKLNHVYFEAGCHTAMVQLSQDDFSLLTSGERSLAFGIKRSGDPDILPAPLDINQSIKIDFPALPQIAQQILGLANDLSEESALALSNIVSKDAIMNAHILYCAQDHLKDELKVSDTEALKEVITKILGFDTVSHIALGVSAGRAFKIPEEGPLGLKAFWQHALCSATLARKIAQLVPGSFNIDLNISYLIGLFHNFGYLLFGHLFSHEFRLLNKWLLLDRNTPIEILEKRLLGMGRAMNIVGSGHAQLGAWLMQYWGMPKPIVVATRFHHTEGYKGEYASYITLIQLTNQLLKSIGLGDGQNGPLTQENVESLGLTLVEVESCMKSLQEASGLDRMATVLSN